MLAFPLLLIVSILSETISACESGSVACMLLKQRKLKDITEDYTPTIVYSSSTTTSNTDSTPLPVSLSGDAIITTPMPTPMSASVTPEATILTLTSCPEGRTCIGQPTIWTSDDGPFPCTSTSPCIAILPGGDARATTAIASVSNGTSTTTQAATKTSALGQNLQATGYNILTGEKGDATRVLGNVGIYYVAGLLGLMILAAF